MKILDVRDSTLLTVNQRLTYSIFQMGRLIDEHYDETSLDCTPLEQIIIAFASMTPEDARKMYSLIMDLGNNTFGKFIMKTAESEQISFEDTVYYLNVGEKPKQ